MPLFLVCNFILLWHSHSIIIRICVAYIHDPNTTLAIDFKVRFNGFLTWLCVRPQLLCPLIISYYILHMSVSPWDDVSHTFMTSVWPWPLASIFSMNLCFGKIVFALWLGHTKFDMSGYIIMKKSTWCVHSWSLYDLELCGVVGGIRN